MAKKHKKDTEYQAPALPYEGVLGRPPSIKEAEVDSHINNVAKVLDENPHVEEIRINLSNFYASFRNQMVPGVEPHVQDLIRKSTTGLTLIIQQPRRKPRKSYLRQVFMPSPYSTVKSFTPGVRAYLVDLDTKAKVLFHGDVEVKHRLAVEMDFDMAKSHREQVLRFSEEARLLESQYCVYSVTTEETARGK